MVCHISTVLAVGTSVVVIIAIALMSKLCLCEVAGKAGRTALRQSRSRLVAATVRTCSVFDILFPHCQHITSHHSLIYTSMVVVFCLMANSPHPVSQETETRLPRGRSSLPCVVELDGWGGRELL